MALGIDHCKTVGRTSNSVFLVHKMLYDGVTVSE